LGKNRNNGIIMAPNKPSNGWKKSVGVLSAIFILVILKLNLARLSIWEGVLVTILLSAFYFLFARSFSAKGARLFRAQGIISLFWKITPVGEGSYSIASKSSKLALTTGLVQLKSANGIVLQTLTGDATQQWDIDTP